MPVRRSPAAFATGGVTSALAPQAGAVDGAELPGALATDALVADGDLLERGVDRRLAPWPAAVVPWSTLFADFAHDGAAVNPGTGTARAFSLEALRASTYVPAGAEGRSPLVFVEGANQWLEVGAARARRHADRLGVPIAVVHNPSFVREIGAQPPMLARLHRAFEGASNLVLHGGRFSERAAVNVAYAMVEAMRANRPAFFAGESQGSILLGHALQRAHDAWVRARAPVIGAPAAEQEFQERAGTSLFVMTFGNAWPSYPDGPNYLHLSIDGDPVPKDGSRPDNRPEHARRRYVVFDRLFPGNDNFENHNIAFVNELLRRSCELNGVDPGELPRVFELFRCGTGGERAPARLANAAEVAWPADMAAQLWDPERNRATVASWQGTPGAGP